MKHRSVTLIVSSYLLALVACTGTSHVTTPTEDDTVYTPTEIEICSDSMLALMDSVEAGNITVLKDFIAQGGDPECECYENSRVVPVLYRLGDKVRYSKSYDLISYYLSLNISQDYKDLMLGYYVGDQFPEITKLLVENNSRISYRTARCIPLDTTNYNKLLKLGYDINGQDPKDGNTDFSQFAMCPCPDGAKEIKASMRYLHEHGADHTIKNAQGKTALDLAEHPKIRAYIKRL